MVIHFLSLIGPWHKPTLEDLGSSIKNMASQLATLKNIIKNLEEAPSPKALGLLHDKSDTMSDCNDIINAGQTGQEHEKSDGSESKDDLDVDFNCISVSRTWGQTFMIMWLKRIIVLYLSRETLKHHKRYIVIV